MFGQPFSFSKLPHCWLVSNQSCGDSSFHQTIVSEANLPLPRHWPPWVFSGWMGDDGESFTADYLGSLVIDSVTWLSTVSRSVNLILRQFFSSHQLNSSQSSVCNWSSVAFVVSCATNQSNIRYTKAAKADLSAVASGEFGPSSCQESSLSQLDSGVSESGVSLIQVFQFKLWFQKLTQDKLANSPLKHVKQLTNIWNTWNSWPTFQTHETADQDLKSLDKPGK